MLGHFQVRSAAPAPLRWLHQLYDDGAEVTLPTAERDGLARRDRDWLSTYQAAGSPQTPSLPATTIGPTAACECTEAAKPRSGDVRPYR